MLYTVVLEEPDPTMEDAARAMAVPANRLDAEFGVLSVDPSAKRYAVRVDADALEELPDEAGGEVAGPFADPRIEPFGPPEAGHDDD